jgi:hypothetical protein
MTTIQTVVTIILTPTLIVGGLVFILRKLFEQLLSRDIENYKAKLQIEFEHSKLRLENELQARLFEFQTKFSLYRQAQAEVIGELYEILSETEMIVSSLVNPVQSHDRKTQPERIDEAEEQKVRLARFLNKKRIYLDENVCQKMDTVIVALQKALVRFEGSQRGPLILEMWHDAWKVMEEEVPPIKRALERAFRQALSATSGKEPQGVLDG